MLGKINEWTYFFCCRPIYHLLFDLLQTRVDMCMCLFMCGQTICDVIWCNLTVGRDVQQGEEPWEKPQDRSSRKRGGELTVPISHLPPSMPPPGPQCAPLRLVLAQCLTGDRDASSSYLKNSRLCHPQKTD